MIEYKFDLDVVHGNVPIVVPLKQYQDAYTLIFHLYSRIGALNIPEDAVASIRGTKSDKNGISLEATLDRATNDVTVNVVKQITAVAGKGAYELVLTSGDTEFITATFYIDVQRSALDIDTLPSDSLIKELAECINQADEIVAAGRRVEEACKKVFDIEENLTNSVTKAMSDASNAMNEAGAAANAVEDIKMSNETLHLQIQEKVDGAFVEEGSLYLTSNNEVKVGPLGPFAGSGGGGGGGSSGNAAVMKVTNASGFLSKTITDSDACEISIQWSSIEDDLATGDGVMTIIVSGAVAATRNVTQGLCVIDVSKFLKLGSNVVAIKVADVYGNSRTINFSINVLQLSINSSFDASLAYSGAISFMFVPYGAVKKTIHFIIDGDEIDTMSTTVSGRQQSWTIPAQQHGAHTFEVYFDCEINGAIVESNRLFYEIICVATGNTRKILTSSFNVKTISQYSTVYIPFMCYDPQSLTSEIVIYANDVEVSRQTVDRTQQVFAYRVDKVETIKFVIDAGKGVTKTLNLEVTESEIELKPTEEDLALHLFSRGRSNSEENPGLWSFKNINATFSNFNWASDGWLTDDEGVDVLRLSGDAKVEIPYKVFEQDCRSAGKTIELEFATHSIRNYDTIVMSCMSNNRGFRLTTQKAELKSELSSIFTQYKEDEHVRVAFVIQKQSENRLIMMYINGVMSGAVRYPETGDNFVQTSPVGISIGSQECVTDIYRIRIYDNSLNKEQILDNWIADTQSTEVMIERYWRNRIYDAYGNVVISNLPATLPYLLIQSETLPQSKGDKKTVSGRFVNPANPSKNFSFENAEFDVQGTSSQFYYRKNYKGKYNSGFILPSGAVANKYAMNAKAIPVNTFCFKADVASSEGANNVELVRFYCDTCPFDLSEALSKEGVRQGIDGFPIVVFWNNGVETVFLGKYNFNNDKSTEDVFGFEDGDESWEIRNNTGKYTIWKADDFSGTAWQNDFEARFPDGSTYVENLEKLAKWIKSTDAEAATNNALPSSVTYSGVQYTKDTPEYRLAKFKAEFKDWFVFDAMIFNYLFTEAFLMVDNRAKNAFPTYYKSLEKWLILPYDYDTGLGINNEGALVFGYSLEDTDLTESGAYVYNGQNSVLYVNIRKCFYEEIKAMYAKLRADDKWSYSIVEKRFEDHQAVWPEAIFNEDAQVKYLDPLLEDGDASYLGMLQGSKAEQRKQWLYNRFRYLDSKYICGDAVDSENVVTLRGYALGAGISIVPYADIYAAINWANSIIDTKRVFRGNEVFFENPLDAVNDTEIYIYSASSIAEIGDLAPMKVGYANFSKATKLQVIKVGDEASSYSNENMTSLNFGNNILLLKVDARNCPNLGTGEQQIVDMSGCLNLEEAYFTGTSIKGVTLASGCAISKLYLPKTIVNLTLKNLKKLTDLQLQSYDNLTTLNLENNNDAVDARSILSKMVVSDTSKPRVRIIGFNWTFNTVDEIETFFDELDKFAGVDEHDNNLDKPQVSGTIFIDEITGSDLKRLLSRYPYVNYEYNTLTSFLRYYNGAELVYTETIENGGNGTHSGTYTKPSSAQYDFSFAGWSSDPAAEEVDLDALKNVKADRNVYAVYSKTVRKYNVTFVDAVGNVMEVKKEIPYGSSVTYSGETPTKASTTAYHFEFNGWSKVEGGSADPDALNNIIGETTLYAAYKPIERVYHTVIYKVKTTAIKTYLVEHGCDSVYDGDTPTLESTAQYDFSFRGWGDGISVDNAITKNITEDREIIAVFSSILRKYTVKFVNYSGAVLKTVTDVPYGSSAAQYAPTSVTFDGGDEIKDFMTFSGAWEPGFSAIVGDTTYKAQFVDSRKQTYKLLCGVADIVDPPADSGVESITVLKCGNMLLTPYSYYSFEWPDLTIDLKALKTVTNSCLAYKRKLKSVNLPALEEVNNSGASMHFMSYLDPVGDPIDFELPKLKKLDAYRTFAGSTFFKTISFPVIEELSGQYSFYSCNNLQEFVLENAKITKNSYFFYTATVMKKLILKNVSMHGAFTNNALPNSLREIRFENFEDTSVTQASGTRTYTIAFNNDAFYGSSSYVEKVCYISLAEAMLKHSGSINVPCLATFYQYPGGSLILDINKVVYASSAFTNVSKNMHVYVPDDLVESYKAATNWSSIADRIHPISEYTET